MYGMATPAIVILKFLGVILVVLVVIGLFNAARMA